MLLRYYELIRKYMVSEQYKSDKNTSGFQAAMDIIGDTYLAMCSYKKIDKNQVDKYLSYVHVYGILNILELQQDAIKAIYKCLLDRKYNPDKDNELKDIREVRNKATSHSVEYIRKEDKFQGYGIIRSSLSIASFEYYSFSDNCSHIQVNIFEMIERQEKRLIELLAEICQELNLREEQ
ncbi:hypothetical protein ACEQ103284_05510 [Actinobacillus equuli subsp. equuli]|uniref:HEPN domain-containing protein n=2 Tax=Actinobacillus equuli TaxID=718 RepID=A0AAX3FKA4_ACTEU|nr:hypothetical protein [Actinobacillus equuli]AIZ80344.1 hypothetical protein ACEE_11430 [Actinobacillus equuli subsp. equuli]WGE44448.1 hypothetical protein NYR65_11305 [Actinobacillus equuli subsp. equuli]VEE91786.1 Uncharacterised protein [Actinobacillus equuli]